MLMKTNYKLLLEQTFRTPIKHIFGSYFIDTNSQVYYNTRPLRPGWRRSRSNAIYLTFRLWNNETKKVETHYAHRLGAKYFIGDIEGLTVNHNNKNTLDNDIYTNLSIMTMKENCEHKLTYDEIRIHRKREKIVRFVLREVRQ